MDTVFTRADYRRLPEGYPAQLLDGHLVKHPAPSYGHQFFVGRILRALMDVVEEGCAVAAPIDIEIDELTVLQPDAVVWAEPPPLDAQVNPLPILALEVLSPATEERDRGIKSRRLLGAGVAEVWLVDPRRREITIRTLGDTRLARGGERAVSRAVPGFALVPAHLFARP